MRLVGTLDMWVMSDHQLLLPLLHHQTCSADHQIRTKCLRPECRRGAASVGLWAGMKGTSQVVCPGEPRCVQELEAAHRTVGQ